MFLLPTFLLERLRGFTPSAVVAHWSVECHFMSRSLILWSSALLPFRPQRTWVTIVTKEAVWDFTLYRGYHFLILGADSQHMFHIVWPSGQVRLSQTRLQIFWILLEKHCLPKAPPIHQEVLDNILWNPLPVFTSWCAKCLLHCGQVVKLDCEVFFWESWGFNSFVLAYGPSRQTCPSTSLSWPWGLQVVLQQPTTSPTKNFILSGHLGKSD